MIALDTNLLIRLLTRDDADQVAVVEEIISQAVVNDEACLLPDIVLCELEWVLVDGYGVPRSRLVTVLQGLMSESHFQVENRNRLRRALDAYAGGKGDLSDYLLGETGADFGARTTFTFDKALRDHPAFTVLSP